MEVHVPKVEFIWGRYAVNVWKFPTTSLVSIIQSAVSEMKRKDR